MRMELDLELSQHKLAAMPRTDQFSTRLLLVCVSQCGEHVSKDALRPETQTIQNDICKNDDLLASKNTQKGHAIHAILQQQGRLA